MRDDGQAPNEHGRVRAANWRRLARHVPACPRCKDELLVINDGKTETLRFICAGLVDWFRRAASLLELEERLIDGTGNTNFFLGEVSAFDEDSD